MCKKDYNGFKYFIPNKARDALKNNKPRVNIFPFTEIKWKQLLKKNTHQACAQVKFTE